MTGNNGREGLTVTDRDANSEIILLFDSQNDTSNSNNIKLEDLLTDVTGVIDYIAYQYYIRPVTASSIKFFSHFCLTITVCHQVQREM